MQTLVQHTPRWYLSSRPLTRLAWLMVVSKQGSNVTTLTNGERNRAARGFPSLGRSRFDTRREASGWTNGSSVDRCNCFAEIHHRVPLGRPGWVIVRVRATAKLIISACLEIYCMQSWGLLLSSYGLGRSLTEDTLICAAVPNYWHGRIQWRKSRQIL